MVRIKKLGDKGWEGVIWETEDEERLSWKVGDKHIGDTTGRFFEDGGWEDFGRDTDGIDYFGTERG